MRIIRETDFNVSEWSGGVTRELFIYPTGSTLSARDFDLRVSSAIIRQPASKFSDFTGFTRYIMPLDGDIRLTRGGSTVNLARRQLFAFSGSDEVWSENTLSAVDFNIIVRNGLPATVSLVTSGYGSAAKSMSVVYAVDHCSVNNRGLQPGEIAVVEGSIRIDGLAVWACLF